MLKVEKEKHLCTFYLELWGRERKEKEGGKKWTFSSQSLHKNPYEFAFMTFQLGLLLVGFSRPNF